MIVNLNLNFRRHPWLLWNFSLTLIILITISYVSGHFTREWAVEIEGGDEEANKIAERNGFYNGGKIFENVYHFVHRRLAKRSSKPSNHHHWKLTRDPAVRWAQQQKAKKRVKRDYIKHYQLPVKQKKRSRSKNFASKIHTKNFSPPELSDPKWNLMWYLNRGGSFDMNVQQAWLNGATGKNVVVTILDDGLEKDHPDLIQNYDPNASYDVNGRDPDPMPRYDLIDSNRHGTRCAGEVAAKANNTICAVGVAYEASVGGVRMLDGDVTDAVEARSLALNPQHIDIYSASWGPDDDGKTVDGPGQLATRAFVEGVSRGRNGKGSIFVWASGNGGRDEDNCNCDGYTNSIWTLSISSATEKGSVPWYSEACSSTLATTYSSGALGERQIITTDLHHGCTTSHTGTSASAPLAAGICALALHANMDLTWRDMQHIVVRTARPENLNAPDWQINGVGRKVSHRFGYGLMDANGMVELARNWSTVPPQRKCEVPSGHVDKVIPPKSFVTLTLEVSDCPGVNYLEHVQSKVTLSADRRGDMEIFLISPSGTKSNLLAIRHRDYSRAGFHSWPFMTVHMWGESPLGIWKLEIHNNGIFFSQNTAKVQNWTLIFYGTETEASGHPSKSDVAIPPKSVNPLQGNTLDEASKAGHLSASSRDDNDGRTDTRDRDHQKLDDRNGKEDVRSSGSPGLYPTPVLPSSNDGFGDTGSHYQSKKGSVSGTKVSNISSSSGCFELNSIGGCLGCKFPLYLFGDHCVEHCPDHTFDSNSTSSTQRTCVHCHYSCQTCSGPFDYQCRTCWPDALLHNPRPEEIFCRPKALLEAYLHQSSLLKLVIPIFIGLFCFILGFSVYVFKRRPKAFESFPLTRELGNAPIRLRGGIPYSPSYTPVTVNDKDQLMTETLPFRDQVSDEDL